MTYTQYGKSDTISMAVLTRATTYAEKWAIVAPSQEKSKIIMGFIIKHCFENEYTMSRFQLKEGESIDKIRRERTKNRLTFDLGEGKMGEIFILSAESRLKNQTEDIGNALMGFGAPNLVMDEAALISNESDAKAMRMVGGFTAQGLDFVVKIGNPFKRNHFLAAFEDPAYHKINADYHVGVREGRLTEKFIEEMRKKPFFGVQYDNKFPDAGEIDEKNWTQLVTEEEVLSAMITESDEDKMKHIGEKRLGHDVARGGANFSTWALRSMNYMELLAKSRSDNLIETGAQTMHLARENGVKAQNVFIDDVGVGGGETDSVRGQMFLATPINGGNTALDMGRFANMRAEAYWRLREWIKKGGKLSRHDEWYQIAKVKYKPDSKGRLRIMGKDEMRAMGIDSPDVADAGSLTFARREHYDVEERHQQRDKKKRQRAKGNGLSLRMAGY
jgi:hypothetical protein